jgi:carbon storage regulator
MLYLVRKLGESIIINNNIRVEVVDVKGGSVKLGFEFPPDATVLRAEVHQRILEQNIMAARGQVDDSDALADLDLKPKPPKK